MMMNDMMPTIEEALTPDIEAQLEHERSEHEREERERADAWAAIEHEHGPLLTRSEWVRHECDYSEYVDMVWKD